MRKIFVIGQGLNYANWMEGEITYKIEDADLVVLTGGADIDPSRYGEKAHPRTYSSPERDHYEFEDLQTAVDLGKPVIGICRGAQLVCVFNKGRLVQDQPNPGTHMMMTKEGIELPTSSLHHQACYPYDLPEEDYQILAWTENMLARHQDGNGDEMNPPKEVEAIYFPKTRCLGIQGHPEMMDLKGESIKHFRNWLNNLISNKPI